MGIGPPAVQDAFMKHERISTVARLPIKVGMSKRAAAAEPAEASPYPRRVETSRSILSEGYCVSR